MKTFLWKEIQNFPPERICKIAARSGDLELFRKYENGAELDMYFTDSAILGGNVEIFGDRFLEVSPDLIHSLMRDCELKNPMLLHLKNNIDKCPQIKHRTFEYYCAGYFHENISKNIEDAHDYYIYFFSGICASQRDFKISDYILDLSFPFVSKEVLNLLDSNNLEFLKRDLKYKDTNLNFMKNLDKYLYWRLDEHYKNLEKLG